MANSSEQQDLLRYKYFRIYSHKRLAYASLLCAIFASIVLLFVSSHSGNKDALLAISGLTAGYAAFFSTYYGKRLYKKTSRNQIFIICGRDDLKKAREIAKDLTERGFSPWLDVEEVQPGQRVSITRAKGLEESSAAILLVSSGLDVSNKNIYDELQIAMNSMSSADPLYSPVIPVRLDETPVPPILRDVYAVNYQDNDSLDLLSKALHRVIKGI